MFVGSVSLSLPTRLRVSANRFARRRRGRRGHAKYINKLFVGSLGAQADTAKQALETRVRAQAINPRVRFEKPRKVQRFLQIGFLQELEGFVLLTKSSVYGCGDIR